MKERDASWQLAHVLHAEWSAIASQRASSHPGDPWFADEVNRFGIALSGGGIRAATIAYGFLEVLNGFKLLSQADYLSTVSGGGFAGGYFHSTLWEQRQTADPFRKLFTAEDQNWLTSCGK